MKYLKKIFENWDKKDDPVYNDILNSLVYINDKFGEPTIYPDKSDNVVYADFRQRFETEKKQMEDNGDLDRPFEISLSHTTLHIYPEEKKTYIVI